MMLNQSRTLCSNMAVLLFFRNHPRWGASNIPLLRQVPAEYQDGISRPKGWDPSVNVNGHLLPLVFSPLNRMFPVL